MRIGFLAVLAGHCCVLAATPQLAQAQIVLDQIGKGGGKPARRPAPKVAPPPALPGAASSGSAAPASASPDRHGADRGTVRRDQSRGHPARATRSAVAPICTGTTCSGMTPLELSVDLGRNDISFLLLSMRGADDDRPARSAGRRKAAAKRPRPSHRRRSRCPQQPRDLPERSRLRRRLPSQTARLFSGDGGAPNPNAGFLGFDTSRR